MTHPKFNSDAEFVTYAVGLLNRMPRSLPHAFHQNSFGALLAVGRRNLAARMPTYLEGYPALSVQHSDSILDSIWEQSVVMGIETYAALGRSFEAAPDDTPISFDEVWACALDRMKPESDSALSFHAAVHQFGPIHALRGNAMMSIEVAVAPLVSDVEARHTLLGIAENHFTLGMAVESAYVHCIAEKRRFNTMLISLLEAVTGGPIEVGDENIERDLRAQISALMNSSDNIHPWPEDEVCLCGQSLKPFIFCCDPHRPFDIAAYRPLFSADFEVHRTCCDRSFPGFVCDICGRVYTWQKGEVSSVCDGDEE